MTDEQWFTGAAEVAKRSRCKKRKVGALLVQGGTPIGRGFNDGDPNDEPCPRAELPSGEGYDLCYQVCHQTLHAEVAAIQDALRNWYWDEIEGSTLYVAGHDHACEACKATAERYGITIRIAHE